MLHNKCSISKTTGYLCNLLLDFYLSYCKILMNYINLCFTNVLYVHVLTFI